MQQQGLGLFVCLLSGMVVSDSAAPWTAAHRAPPSVGFFRQEYWSGLLFSPPGDLPGIKPTSPALAGGFFTTGPPGKSLELFVLLLKVVID